MNAKPNQRKWLFGYMVLAIVGVLTCVNGSMVFGLVNMIAAGSSASHHALSVDQRDSSVKRHLRSNIVKEITDGTNEDRTFPIAAISEESISFLPRLTYQPLNELDKLETDKLVLFLKAVPKITLYESIIRTNILLVIDKSSASAAPSILEAVRKVPGMGKIADDTEVSLILKWANDRRINDVFMLLAAGQKENDFFKSNKMNAWIYSYKVIEHLDPYMALFAQLLQHMGEERLAQMLLLAKEDVASKETATEVEKSLEVWRMDGVYQTIFMFKDLGLRIEDAKVFESQGWETWVSFMTKLENRRPFEDQELASSIAYTLWVLAGDRRMVELVAIAKTVDRTKQFAGEWEKIWPSDEDAAAKHQRLGNY